MKRSPEITVVMPAYNASRFIDATLQSAEEQSFSNIEIIVVDDCSSDDTASLVRDMSLHDSRVKLIKLAKNEGVANARNVGIGLAEGKWIALLDSDDIWEPYKLEKQLGMAQQYRLDLVYSSYDFIDEEGRPIDRSYIVPESISYETMLSRNVFGCSTVMARSELLKNNPFRTDFYHEDYLLWMILLRAGISAGGVVDILMHYRQTGGSRSSNKARAAKHRWEIYRKGLGMSLLESVSAFTRYGITGMKKYYL